MAALRSSFGRLQNRVAIVTGASRGIGRAIALAYARENASVVCADIWDSAPSGGKSTHQEIQENGGKSMFVKTDVGDSESMKNLVETTVKSFSRLDIMVNNAGIAREAGNPQPIYEMPEEVYDSTMRVNSKGVWLGCKYAGQQMIKQDIPAGSTSRGWIINMASVLGLTGKNGTSAYSSSKGSIIGMSRAAAMDYAPFKIHCNSICPGFTDTAMIEPLTQNDEVRKALDAAHPLKGVGSPEDIARAAVFLASEDASWITGVALPVDGGYVAQ
ncbi:uncharacterized protein Z518_10781 [Rhinocladiella mackenziei CBS 650.93]|uniref:Uncharacterized protein n=1 Tax=Rhinocladiella mackenziei CBS 650.93 TaxID=1442369 RepID=A0A0D2I271_9EURO|nr:uncharacterized protein Z518_10781 [Rhinocladiella mackenziei CBS 650.93]KIW99853.1 hypothetical protein Z518_10781 [Rhinocladiella mackenziei CBS 650.93]